MVPGAEGRGDSPLQWGTFLTTRGDSKSILCRPSRGVPLPRVRGSVASWGWRSRWRGPTGPWAKGLSALPVHPLRTDAERVFVYYYALIGPGRFEEVEHALLDTLDGLPEAADVAYRNGEELRARLGGKDGFAKEVRLHVGAPVRNDGLLTLPLSWEATGTPGLFPRMDGELVSSTVGPDLTHLAFRGSYRPPLGVMGRALDRAVFHRVAETSVKRFVDRLAAAVTDRLANHARVEGRGGERDG